MSEAGAQQTRPAAGRDSALIHHGAGPCIIHDDAE